MTMNRFLQALALGSLAAGVVLGAARPLVRQVTAAPSSPHQPSLTDFPAAPAKLQMLQAAADPTALRLHAWKLLDNLTRGFADNPDYLAQWEDRADFFWRSKCDLDLSPLCDNPAKVGADTTALDTFDPSSSPQILGTDKMLSTVFYSYDAASYIQMHKLYDGDTLSKRLKVGLTDLGKFPKTSIIVKEIWQGANVIPGGDSQIFIYDSTQVKPTGDDQHLGRIADWGNSFLTLKKVSPNGPLDTTTPCTAIPSRGWHRRSRGLKTIFNIHVVLEYVQEIFIAA